MGELWLNASKLPPVDEDTPLCSVTDVRSIVKSVKWIAMQAIESDLRWALQHECKCWCGMHWAGRNYAVCVHHARVYATVDATACGVRLARALFDPAS